MKYNIIKFSFIVLIQLSIACHPKEKSQLTFVQSDYQMMIPIKNLIDENQIHIPAKVKQVSPPSIEEKPTNNIKTIEDKDFSFYVVKKGDTLFSIALKIFGNGKRWPELFLKNKRQNWRKDPDWLEVGMKIYYK